MNEKSNKILVHKKTFFLRRVYYNNRKPKNKKRKRTVGWGNRKKISPGHFSGELFFFSFVLPASPGWRESEKYKLEKRTKRTSKDNTKKQ